MAPRFRPLTAALFLALMSALLAAGDVGAADRRETRSVASFSAIALSAPLKVELTQGDSDSVGKSDFVATRISGSGDRSEERRVGKECRL